MKGNKDVEQNYIKSYCRSKASSLTFCSSLSPLYFNGKHTKLFINGNSTITATADFFPFMLSMKILSPRPRPSPRLSYAISKHATWGLHLKNKASIFFFKKRLILITFFPKWCHVMGRRLHLNGKYLTQ